MTIIEFLEARIAEDERAARDASHGPWSYSDIDSVGGGTIYDPTVAIAQIQWDVDHVDPRIRRMRPEWQADATGRHIARNHPARVLAECAAKRAIIAQAGEIEKMELVIDEEWGGGLDWLGLGLLITLAAVYSDHPDYQQEWAL